MSSLQKNERIMSFSCPRCLGSLISYPRFADLCLHMEYDHGMWYLGKNTAWPNRFQQLQAEERMLEEELRKTAIEDDHDWSALSSWAGSASDFESPLTLNDQDQRNNMRLKHIEHILNQTKSELDQIKCKVVDRKDEVDTLKKQLVINNRNTALVKSRLQLCNDELHNLRCELTLRDKELEEKKKEAKDLNKFVKTMQLKEKCAKQELRVYLDRLFRRIISTEHQLRIVEHGLAPPESVTIQDQKLCSQQLSSKPVHSSGTQKSTKNHPLNSFSSSKYYKRMAEHASAQGAYERTMRLVFWYLEVDDLLKCRLVCKEWKKRAQRSEYWTKVILKNRFVTSRLLKVISMFCTKTKYILLQGIYGPDETHSGQSSDSNVGCLEAGLDYLLKACNKHLLSLSIIDCADLITDRCLWLAGSSNRFLMKLAYISDCYPAGAESIWSLGAGCRNITTLIVPPITTTESTSCFNNRSLLMIGKCWPDLRVLCIGGSNIDLDGLISISVLCSSLEHLELDHVGEIRNATAEMMTDTGLQNLEAIYFTHTPVSIKALTTFHKKCPKIKMLMVQVAIEDFFNDTSDAANICEYNSRISKLRSLERNSELTGILICEAHSL